MTCNRKIGPYDCCSVVQGDCLELMREISEPMVLITDPPYNVDFTGKNTKHTTRRDDGYIGGDSPLGPLAVSAALQFAKRGAVFTGNRMLFSYPEPQDFGCIYCPSGAGVGRWGWVCFHPIIFYGQRPSPALYPTSITSFDVAERNGHPCPKPDKWMEWIIELASLEHETIFDPFAGSGTTLVAAKKLGRHFLGFEISEEYCKIARDRIARIEAQPTLFEPKPEQLKL